MTRYLVVGEVDKIQSFIFQSSRLREVAGASYLLTQFDDKIRDDMKHARHDVLGSAGGSYRIVVEGNKGAAEAVALELREAFETSVGGTMTTVVVDYEPVHNVIKRGNHALRHAKLAGGEPVALWHSPYHAICESSGIELAVDFAHPSGYKDDNRKTPYHPDERQRYMGATTQKKSDEGAAINLLTKFADHMAEITKRRPIERHGNATEADTYAAYDPRQYVAYLVSDGNGMGELFGHCTPDEYSRFSTKVPVVTQNAIIHAVEGMGAESHRNGVERFPALPLISGGDDVFMLMPAPWAVDVAMRYCASYEDAMSKAVGDSIGALRGSSYRATTGAAVVICKASYPYRVAHQHAHELLNAAKDRAKYIKQSCLIVDFIVGSDTVGISGDLPPQPHVAQQVQQYFLRLRYELRDLPNKKLYELADVVRKIVKPAYLEAVDMFKDEPARIRFDKVLDAVSHKVTIALPDQRSEIAGLIKRIDTTLYPGQGYGNLLTQALAQPLDFLEIVKFWGFCFDLQYRRESYLTEGR